MASTIKLFEISPDIDRARLRRAFSDRQHVQIRNFLTEDAATTIQDILARQTLWGMAWQAGDTGPRFISHSELKNFSEWDQKDVSRRLASAMNDGNYAFNYTRYPMLDAYLGKWDTGGPHDLLLEYLNTEPFLDLVREITGMHELCKADAQATLYQPNQFLAQHDDSHIAEGWRIAYVMNFCRDDWRPDWGGYLQIYDEDGDIVHGYRPRFNALNLFTVPIKHSVSYVPPFAPLGRFAITGWLRDR
ncbi:2OG-Fe(II) oxygenase [Novosphingopyxis sp. YJ-S2-01]|uniref:2OG-Fe(II) oxygenase n=1 Tax=Novosphingopyxis sp. YJ-S2-01 TaxID=2794021 RepID=UPI0018DC2A69|nr:2OG-Fe(II) oxygenase family protein [Novosphingopyxis sp. YJ-S2-01]MBH9536360.1 2OG-Fe(II) oxygenase [Novosphingopyxis sp. YJ-S2-01]